MAYSNRPYYPRHSGYTASRMLQRKFTKKKDSMAAYWFIAKINAELDRKFMEIRPRTRVVHEYFSC